MTDHGPAVPVPGGGGFVRVRLEVAYDGTDFAGFARQPGLRTVQGELDRALAQVLRLPEPPPTVCAGRTDAGVHARGQVVQADVPPAAWAALTGGSSAPGAAAAAASDGGVRASGPADTAGPGEDQAGAVLRRRLAGALPRDVRVLDAAPAPDGFDARFSATWRRYVYRVTDHPAGPDPLVRHLVLAHPRPLDLAALNAAAEVLVGQRDFAAFCRAREGATTIRVLETFSWERPEPWLLEATIVADAFCHSMVRSMVGACLAVGEGRRDLAWLRGVLAARQRSPQVQVVGPQGLTLEAVGYPDADGLAARAEQTRRRRTP